MDRVLKGTLLDLSRKTNLRAIWPNTQGTTFWVPIWGLGLKLPTPKIFWGAFLGKKGFLNTKNLIFPKTLESHPPCVKKPPSEMPARALKTPSTGKKFLSQNFVGAPKGTFEPPGKIGQPPLLWGKKRASFTGFTCPKELFYGGAPPAEKLTPKCSQRPQCCHTNPAGENNNRRGEHQSKRDLFFIIILVYLFFC